MHPNSPSPWSSPSAFAAWGSRLTARRAASAVDYNTRQGYPAATIRLAERALGRPQDGAWSTSDVEAVADWQHRQGLGVDGKLGSTSMRRLAQGFPRVERTLDAAQRKIVMEYTISFEGGRRNPYAAQNRDGEFRGLFDRPKRDARGRRIPPARRVQRHWASRYHPNGGTHIGLSFGAWQGTQRGGTLGHMLRRMANKDRALFDRVFGGTRVATQLLRVANAGPANQGDGRNGRTQPVGGADLWEAPWTARFTASATHEAFREAQREVADEIYLTPALETALRYGFTDQAALAVLFDIAIQFGVGGMRARVRRGLGDAGRAAARPADIEAVIGALPASHRARRLGILGRAESWVHYLSSGASLALGGGGDTQAAVSAYQSAGRAFLRELGARTLSASTAFVERMRGGATPVGERVGLLGPLVHRALTEGVERVVRGLPEELARVGAVSEGLRGAVRQVADRVRALPADVTLAALRRELGRLGQAVLPGAPMHHAVVDAGNNGDAVLAALRGSSASLRQLLPTPQRLERTLYEGWVDRHHGFQGGAMPHRGVLHLRYDLVSGQVTLAKVLAPRGAAVAAGLMATGPRSDGSLDPNRLRCRKYLVIDAPGRARQESGLLDADNRPVSGTLSDAGPFRTALGGRLPLVDRLTG